MRVHADCFLQLFQGVGARVPSHRGVLLHTQMHPLRETIEPAVAQVVREDFLMSRHEYPCRCLKASAQANTVNGSQGNNKASFVLSTLNSGGGVWASCLS